MINNQTLTTFAESLADHAEEIVHKYWRSPIQAEQKEDRSPVTQADTEIEEALRWQIQQEYPEHGILGEEQGAHNIDADYVWVIDPIDGTRSFIAGKPQFTTLIALCHKKRPIFGLIDQPITGERWMGGEGFPSSVLNNMAISTRPCDHLNHALMATTSPEYFSDAAFPGFGMLRASVGDILYGGDAYNYGLLAAGHIDIILEQGLKPYDMMSLVPIIKGAGGHITDWQGNALTMDSKGDVLATGSKTVHEQALEILKALQD